MPTDPTIGAGELNTRVTLLAPIYNEFSDEITGWNQAALTWASLTPVFGMEVNEAGRDVEVVTYTMRLRFRTDLDARWRIQDARHTYEINGISDVEGRHIVLALNCKEVV